MARWLRAIGVDAAFFSDEAGDLEALFRSVTMLTMMPTMTMLVMLLVMLVSPPLSALWFGCAIVLVVDVVVVAAGAVDDAVKVGTADWAHVITVVHIAA